MAEYLVDFIGQTNPDTIFLGHLSSDPVYTGNNSEYFYHTSENAWKVGGSGWTVVADPSTLTGATIISSTSEVEGEFVENNSGVRYIIFHNEEQRWFQFYNRSSTRLPESAGTWPSRAFSGFRTNVGNPFAASQNFEGTNNEDRGAITTPGWFRLRVDWQTVSVAGPGTPIRLLPRMLFVYSGFVDGDFVFLLNNGVRTLARTHHLTRGEVSNLYSRNLLISVSHNYLTLTRDVSSLVFYLDPPAGATHVYPVGIDTRGAAQNPFLSFTEGVQATVVANAAFFGSFGSVRGGTGIVEEATDPVDPGDPAILCMDPSYYIENFSFCSQLVPPPLCLDRGLFSNGGDCRTELNAAAYFSQRDKNFCPLELL